MSAPLIFDIDGIATANWSGFAKEVTDMQTAGKVITQATTPSVDGDKVFLNSSDDFKLSVPIDADNGGATPVYDAFRAAIDVGVTSTNNFIRNRLTQLEVRGQNPDVMEGKRLTISGESSGTFTTSAAHGLKVGDTIRMSGITGTDAATFNNLNFVC